MLVLGVQSDTQTHIGKYRCQHWVFRVTERHTQTGGIVFFIFVFFCVQLQLWKWVWREQNEWNAQTAAGGIYHQSLRLHALKFLVQLCQAPNTTQLFEAPDTTQLSQAPDTTQLSQAPDTTHLKVFIRQTLYKCLKLTFCDRPANSASHTVFLVEHPLLFK